MIQWQILTAWLLVLAAVLVLWGLLAPESSTVLSSSYTNVQ